MEHQHLMGYLRGYLMGYLMGLQVLFYVFLLFIYPPNMVFIRNFPVFSRNITGKGLPKESVLFLRTFEGKDENVWGKGWERLRERNFTSYWLLKSLHMAREPSVGPCFRHFQSRNGQLITQILPSLHRIEKFCFAQMSPKTGKSIGIGGENMKFEAFEHSNLMHFVPFPSVGAMEPCFRQCCNSL